MVNVHFSHANGFPAKTYSFLFEKIEATNIRYINMIGHGEFSLNGDLHNYSKELINNIERNYTQPIVGIGHSFGGAVTFLAAASRPDLFERVILLDPIVFSAKKRLAIRLLKKLGLLAHIGPANKTLKRRLHFSNTDEANAHFSKKKLFNNFNEQCFRAYVEHGFISSENGIKLAFDRKIEAEIFNNPLTKIPNQAHEMSGTLVYGYNSDAFKKEDLHWWRKNMPNFDFIEVSGGHLFPLELPEVTANIINKTK
jgi:pimeloyl-ACP methyl ester carboxylesterase